uniref:DNA-directed RNA polymerases I, II, and III subunit RPABC4 n=1 Tax=Chelonoidis abingdonii TaxID=106734 RepID=A0A8C0IY32_CHEAB
MYVAENQCLLEQDAINGPAHFCQHESNSRLFHSELVSDQSVAVWSSQLPQCNRHAHLQWQGGSHSCVLAPGTRSGQNTDSQKDVQPPKQQPMIYICGECDTKNEIKARDPIRCRERGYRIMYKKRTRRLVVFDAR